MECVSSADAEEPASRGRAQVQEATAAANMMAFREMQSTQAGMLQRITLRPMKLARLDLAQ